MTPAPAAPATPAPAAANPTGPGNGTEVSPSLSENSGQVDLVLQLVQVFAV